MGVAIYSVYRPPQQQQHREERHENRRGLSSARKKKGKKRDECCSIGHTYETTRRCRGQGMTYIPLSAGVIGGDCWGSNMVIYPNSSSHAVSYIYVLRECTARSCAAHSQLPTTSSVRLQRIHTYTTELLSPQSATYSSVLISPRNEQRK